MTTTTLRPVGRSLGIELPGEMLDRLNLKAGDTLVVSETEDGGLRVARAAPDHEAQMHLAREGMRDFRDALRELAK